MSQKILITSALLYANGTIHFGHIAGAYLPGDCYARFNRLKGNDVHYISGSDEYGIAITMSAEIAGRSPKEHVDLFHQINKELFQKLNFSFDHYSRTTWEGHQHPVHQYFNDLVDQGYIEERVTDQLYSEDDKRFLADRYVTGTCPKCGFEEARGDECPQCGAAYEAMDLKNPRCRLTGGPLTLKKTKHWFLMLDKFKERLVAWLETKDWKPNVTNFVRSYIEDLRPRAITRDLQWGIPIPLPNTEGKVLYVWFDAPIGYISASQEWALKQGQPDLWKKYWCDPETKLVNFIGKDNLTFHAVIFPAMTMGQKQPFKLVDELPANEFLKLEGRQFSKTDGWYVDLPEFLQTYSADQIRYVLAANAPETSDAEFTWKDFQLRCNGELVGKFGNLVNRVLTFMQTRCGGKVPEPGPLEEADSLFLDQIQQIVREADGAYATFKVRRASKAIMELAQAGNVYFDLKKPWADAKNPDTHARMNTTISCCLECLKAMALVACPIVPEAAQKIWDLLGQAGEIAHANWNQVMSASLPVGRALPKPSILFKEVEDEQIAQEIEKLHTMSKAKAKPQISYEPLKDLINYEDFDKLDLRVGTIIACEPVPSSKKLFKLEVDLGFEKRTVVSGIKQHYAPEQLLGQKVVVVANLKPAKIMGIESRGMILAAYWQETLRVVSVDGADSGASVN
ncbi:MAG: methionine--tRNA ligase [Chlamydiales bacterium]|nr:methionine--tRNA ligase [Chlamydiales bacterium]